MKIKGRILVVDDHKGSRDIIRFNLEEMEGYEVFEAVCGEECLSKAETLLPDIILLDIVMPEMDGFEVLKNIRQNHLIAEIPVLVLSSRSTTDNVIKALNMGAQDYISKPFDVEELLARVNTVLRMKKAEEELKKSVSLYEHEATLGQLIAGTVHDMNNVLSGLIMYELIQKYLACIMQKLPPDSQSLIEEEIKGIGRYCEHVENSLHMGRTICQNVMNFARGCSIGRQKYSVTDLLETPLGIFARSLKSGGVKLMRRQDTDHPYYIECNKGEIQRVFLNLIMNAIQAMDNISPKLLTIETSLEEEMVLIVISDTGCGIEPEHLPRVFDKFFTTKKEMSGSGIGLNQVKSIVQAHGGSIDVESIRGRGTSFFLRFPRALDIDSNLCCYGMEK